MTLMAMMSLLITYLASFACEKPLTQTRHRSRLCSVCGKHSKAWWSTLGVLEHSKLTPPTSLGPQG